MNNIVSRLAIACVSLIAINLIFTGISTAKIDPQTIVGLWLLDEGTGKTVKDFSGNGHDGDIVGAVNWTKESKFGNALEFPGNASSYVTIPHDDSLNLVTMTLTAWIKIGELPDSIAPIYKVTPGDVRNYCHRVWAGGDFLHSFALEFTVGAGKYHAASSKTNVVDGKWHHVVGTYDKEAIRVYVDGILDGEVSFSGTPDTTPGPILLGARSTKGILDEVGIFNEALSGADIKHIMNSGLKNAAAAVSPDKKLSTVWGKLKAGN